MSVHELARQIRTGQHIPDILDCLAQLSNDEVPTPPKLARAMLDILPDEVWGKVDYVWLDPFCKSGIFLRETAARLLEGLSDQIPDFNERRDHIYRYMLRGTSITEMTGMISRRSLYYSRDASGPASVVHFADPAGNLPFVRSSHTFPKKKDGTVTGGCTTCGAPLDLERGPERENYAYSFIHQAYPTEEMSNMKFDVVVGNPPYQIGSGDTSETPVYNLFVERAIAMNPRYVVMVTPSRWFTGGKGLDGYRSRMIADRHLAKLVDNPKLFDCFPGVEIKGGVSYFLWDRGHNGDCEFSTRINGEVVSTRTRDLRDGDGVVIRSNDAASILEKVQAAKEPNIVHRISSQTPFGIYTNFKGYSPQPSTKTPIRLHVRRGLEAWVGHEHITAHPEWIAPIKVLIPYAGDGHGRIPAKVIGEPFVVAGNSACTQTYSVAGTWESVDEAENFAAYLRTKFVRFLVHQRKITQHTRPDVFQFVPDLPMDTLWTDEALYARFEFDADEIAYVESQIKPMLAGGDDDDE